MPGGGIVFGVLVKGGDLRPVLRTTCAFLILFLQTYDRLLLPLVIEGEKPQIYNVCVSNS